jgi:hypothetical protein
MKRRLIGVGTAFAAGAMLLALNGCGSGTDPGTEAVGSMQEELLTLPGAWYTTTPHFAWCTVNSAAPTPNCVVPFSHNSLGGSNTVVKLATGRYRVTMPGMAFNGNPQAVALGTSHHCHSNTFGTTGSGVVIDVACRTAAGAMTDGSFVVTYLREFNTGGVLGAYARVRASFGGAPLVNDTWNSTGGAISATRITTGQYNVDFAGQAATADTVMVTAASTGLAGHCKARTWGAIGAAVRVVVDCYNPAGGYQDNDFTISYGRNIRGDARNTTPTGTQGGFSRVTAGGAVNPTFSRNSCVAGSNSSTHPAVGTYADKIHVVAASPTYSLPNVALTMAVGPGPSYCNLSSLWSTSLPTSDPIVNVRCYSGAGTAQDNEHNSSFMLQAPSGC